MIIGSGMIARAFQRYERNDGVLFFASGVANSGETDAQEFDREISALRDAMVRHRDRLLVYFGTCSVGDSDAARRPYVLHKSRMEHMIMEGHRRSVIFRLSQVVGRSQNRMTLMNFLYDRIAGGEELMVWRNATRYLIDIDDVVCIAGQVIDSGRYVNTIRSIAGRQYPILDIINGLERICGKTARFHMVDKGASFPVVDPVIDAIAVELGIRFDDGYLDLILNKYYGLSTETTG